MKKGIIVFGLLGLIILGGLYAKSKYYDPKHRLVNAKKVVNKLVDSDELKNGDLIFQTSLSRQSKAIQLATKSIYSHCGLIYKNGKDFYVFEAVQPVKLTPLDKWIARGKDGKFVIKRLKNADKVLTPSTIEKMKEVGDQFKGKSYDLTFEWSDDKIYCSELIWKIYQRATGLEIGKLQKLKDFDLSDKAVQAKMKERYGDKIPLDETVISPVAIYDSELLMTVKSNE
ncbi:MAG: YiiX family permuted papain-like enzyme [Bacteroidota bacterium]